MTISYYVLLCMTIFCQAQAEYLPINWTEAGIIGFGSESHYEDPAVTPLAPCPCDYTSNHCDTTCCCDKDCSPFHLAAFSCLEGLQGGQRTDKNIDNNCKYQGPYSPEWHDLLCYITENNPYLGLFFQNLPSIQNYQKYLDKVSVPQYSYEDTDIHLQQEDSQLYYVFGTGIEVAIHLEDTISIGFLTLPHPVLNGVCIDHVPVHFLQDVSHDCSLLLTPELCETEQYFSSQYYLRNSDSVNSDPFTIIGNLTGQQVVSAEVSYECVQDVSKFIKVEGLRTFPEQLWKSDKIPFNECDHQKVPYYNKTSQMCENVVLHVEYHMKWKGASIQEVQANIVIGNVPVSLEKVSKIYGRESMKVEPKKVNSFVAVEQTPPRRKSFIMSANSSLYLIQHFEVKFYHVGYYNSSNDTLMNITSNSGNDTSEDGQSLFSSPSITERSGNPGYQHGKPLLAGYIVYNNSDEANTSSNSLLFVDINDETGLYIFSPGGECFEEKRERIGFGVDTMSACYFSWNATVSCSELSERITTALYSLVKGDVVSKFGWPNITRENEFLPVVWDNQEPELKPVTNACPIISSMEYEIVYQDVVDTDKSPISVHQLLGCYIRFHHHEVRYHPNMPSSSVYLSTSVKFFKSKKPSGLSRFWEVMDDRWCSGGICWHEILQPWSHREYGEGGVVVGQMYTASFTDLITNTILMVVIFIPIVILIIQHNYKVRL
ncbi:tectonic-2-like [Penaeus chinensis]|uniref:tectonic-2-like n=1 Tax=Penaeus chinensis TaxID=139456 RepID=UPI001FB7CE07|nr:tectonic-2-like [Penaeus chinensis]